MILTLSYGITMAGTGLPITGKHYNINIIGHPKNVECISGDDSNGRAIMVPLRNVGGTSNLVCQAGPNPDQQTVFVDDEYPTWVTQEPAGAKIYFVPGDHFEIMDRDACDSNGAKIMVPTIDQTDPLDPTKTQPVIAVDVFIRVLGKPNTCMNITGYAYDATQQLWFWSGTVYLNRSTGKSTFVKATDLFDVWWCDVVVNPTTGALECAAGTEAELSVFNDVFETYFWNIINDGTRLVQVRLYPRSL